MKRTTAANLTILVGIILVMTSPVFALLGAASMINSLGLILTGRTQEAVSSMMVGIWSPIMLVAGLYVGGLLIAVGVYVRLQSMSTALIVPDTRLCPQCGKNNLPTNKFCDKCGAKFSTEQS
jgi:hypothetical protein